MRTFYTIVALALASTAAADYADMDQYLMARAQTSTMPTTHLVSTLAAKGGFGDSRRRFGDSRRRFADSRRRFGDSRRRRTHYARRRACAQGRYQNRAGDTCSNCDSGRYQDASNHDIESCKPHSTCTAPMAATNGEGQYESTSAEPHRDRVCTPLNVCHDYQYIAVSETPYSQRVCENCPYAYKANDDRSACYAYKCTHLKCKHVRHSCHKANLDETARTPTTVGSLNGGVDLFDNTLNNECDGMKLFHSTVTRHDAAESTCGPNVGHWCGMGVVTGDATKCECAPKNLKPTHVDKGLGSTPNVKGWTGHSDLRKLSHPNDSQVKGFARAGTPNARDRDTAVEYLGTNAKDDSSWP